MKYTELNKNSIDGTQIKEFKIDFEKTLSNLCYTMVPIGDEPISMHIIEAGWYDNGPTFHIITEYGDIAESTYEYGNMQFVTHKVPAFKGVWESKQPDVVVSGIAIIKTPNDQELGKKIRETCIASIKHAKNSDLLF